MTKDEVRATNQHSGFVHRLHRRTDGTSASDKSVSQGSSCALAYLRDWALPLILRTERYCEPQAIRVNWRLPISRTSENLRTLPAFRDGATAEFRKRLDCCRSAHTAGVTRFPMPVGLRRSTGTKATSFPYSMRFRAISPCPDPASCPVGAPGQAFAESRPWPSAR
jgi:hypothetical protein